MKNVLGHHFVEMELPLQVERDSIGYLIALVLPYLVDGVWESLLCALKEQCVEIPYVRTLCVSENGVL